MSPFSCLLTVHIARFGSTIIESAAAASTTSSSRMKSNVGFAFDGSGHGGGVLLEELGIVRV